MPYRETAQTRARRDAARERIVAAARDQVAEGGYASASVQAVARRARVATGSVYRHFPSKAELFSEVRRRRGGIRAPRPGGSDDALRTARRAGRPRGGDGAPALPPRLPRRIQASAR